MKRIFLYFIGLAFVALNGNALIALAADVVVIKSNDIAPYNQAIEGFREVNSDFSEYNLQGDSGKFEEIIKRVNYEKPKVIFALGALAAIRAKANISNLPIIYSIVLSPEGKNLMGDNISGISIEVNTKEQFTVLKKVMPKIKKIGVLYSNITENIIVKAQESARDLGLELIAIKLQKPEDVPNNINWLITKIDALWLVPDSIVVNQDSLQYILLLTLENKIPFMVYNEHFVKAGALLSPVINYTNIGRQAGKLSRRILEDNKMLKSEISPPEGIEWAINLQTAENMGLKIPKHVLESFRYVYK